MKKQTLVLFAVIAMMLTLSIANVAAQALKSAKANIAFGFKINGKTFPAGEYYFETISRNNESLLQVRGKNKRQNALILADSVTKGERQSPRLVFERRGNDYFLSQIFLSGDQTGFSFRRPQSDEENERDLARNEKNVVIVKLGK